MKTKLIFAAIAALGLSAAYANGKLKDADTDGDGNISQAEFTVAHTSGLAERFAGIDTNADGLLSKDELRATHEAWRTERDGQRKGKHDRGHKPEKMIEHLDADGSGSLSQAELSGARYSPDSDTFLAADTNGNSELDASELKAMMKEHRGKHRETKNNTDY